MEEAAFGALISVGVVRRLPKKKTGLAANAGFKAVHPRVVAHQMSVQMEKASSIAKILQAGLFAQNEVASMVFACSHVCHTMPGHQATSDRSKEVCNSIKSRCPQHDTCHITFHSSVRSGRIRGKTVKIRNFKSSSSNCFCIHVASHQGGQRFKKTRLDTWAIQKPPLRPWPSTGNLQFLKSDREMRF